MADYQFIDTTGVIVPDTGDVKTTVEGEFKAALGQDLITADNTPQGALIVAETTARSGVLRNNATVANQINPNLAGGVFLDAIWALTGGARKAATKSVVPGVSLLGLPGTVIAAGSQASLVDGTLFESLAAVTLDGGGNGTVDFRAVDTGPIAVAPGALNRVVSAVLGWDSVTNPTGTDETTIGRLIEGDTAARRRRKNTLSLQNVALPLSATSALYNLEGVKSLQYRENFTKADATIDGIFLLANSVWACVDGGADADIAAALLANKSLGANWNGAVTVNLPHPGSGQVYPVKFDRPASVALAARVTVRKGSALGDIPQTVRAAIVAYATGQIEGETGFTVGSNASAFELAGAVSREAPGVYVQKCEISLASVISWTTDEITIALNQKATIAAGAIEVIVL
jgi:uncharacterized phage protein gp47/JayE